MIAMQYSFTLPADYDMSVIDRRIADKGPLLDGFPGLQFKAYLVARRGEHGPEAREPLCAVLCLERRRRPGGIPLRPRLRGGYPELRLAASADLDLLARGSLQGHRPSRLRDARTHDHAGSRFARGYPRERKRRHGPGRRKWCRRLGRRVRSDAMDARTLPSLARTAGTVRGSPTLPGRTRVAVTGPIASRNGQARGHALTSL